jgi:signal transduction histidine kinase
MTTAPFLTANEREVYRQYDLNRRLELTRTIAPTAGAILLIFMVILGFNATHFPASYYPPAKIMRGLGIGDSILTACVIVFALATVAAWRKQQVGFAIIGTIAATNVAVITIEIVWSVGLSGFDFVTVAAFSALSLAVVLAGIIGESWMVLATVILMNVISLVLGFFTIPVHPATETDTSIADLVHLQKFIIISGVLLVQWAFAMMMLTTTSAYRRIMAELGDVRVAYERARQLDDLKDQFISSINHEIRSPVMAMQGYIELLKLADESVSLEKRQALLLRASTAGDNLATLLSSILDARRQDRDADDFTPEIVNVREAISAATLLIDPREGEMQQRALHVNVPPEMVIWGENVRLQQIMTNLLSNAIKYSEPGTPVEVSAVYYAENDAQPGRFFGRSPKKTERRMVEIRVRDYGLGVPPEQIPLLFQRFARLPRDLASTVIGNGLGLFLCRVLVEAMDGTIWVESAGIPGEGSTFHILLPIPSLDQMVHHQVAA